MKQPKTFRRRRIIEGFFGPLWSTEQRNKLFEFGAARGINTYLHAPVVSCEEIHEAKRKGLDKLTLRRARVIFHGIW
jgi:hypothetical protein